MSPEELAAVKARATEAKRWATTDPVSLQPVEFVPLSTREHFDTDMPALVAEVERLQGELAGAEAAKHLLEETRDEAEEATAAYRSALLDLVDAAERVGRELPSHDDPVVHHTLGELAAKAGEAAGTLEEELIGEELVQRIRHAEIDRDQARIEVEQLQKTLADLDDTPHHVLDVRADGWTLKHPLSCRPRLFDCPVNEACQGFDGPPAAAGRYVVDLDGDGRLRIGEEVRRP